MAKTLQFRRGNTAVLATTTGANGEIFVDTQTHQIVVHDGTTQGGFALANASSVTAAISTASSDASTKAATAYSNAYYWANVLSSQAYSNAVSQATSIAASAAATAYSNAASKADSAYSNATSYAATIAATAYANAYYWANALSSQAYSNAVSQAANASNLTTGTVPTARLGSGIANTTTYLRGDGSWQTVSGGSSFINVVENGMNVAIGNTGGKVTLTGNTVIDDAGGAGRLRISAPVYDAFGSTGTTNQVLKNAGSGYLQWGDASGGSSFVNVIENGSNVAIGNTVTGCSYVTVEGTYLTVNSSQGLSVINDLNVGGTARAFGGASLYGNTVVEYATGEGALVLSGKLYANSSLGTAGQVLKTNGSGYTYWGDAASGGSTLTNVFEFNANVYVGNTTSGVTDAVLVTGSQAIVNTYTLKVTTPGYPGNTLIYNDKVVLGAGASRWANIASEGIQLWGTSGDITYANSSGIRVQSAQSYATINSTAVAINGVAVGGGGANLASVAEDVLPSFSDVFDLGSSTKRWNDAYITGNVDINGAALTGTSVITPGSDAVYSNTTTTVVGNTTFGAWVSSATAQNISHQYSDAIPDGERVLVFGTVSNTFKTQMEAVPVGSTVAVLVMGLGFFAATTTTPLSLSKINIGSPTYVIGLSYTGSVPANGYSLVVVQADYTTSTLVTPAVNATTTYTLSTAADIVSNGSVVAADALIGDLLFTNNMITPTTAVSEYSGNTTGTVIVDGDLSVTGSIEVAGQLTLTPTTLATSGTVDINFTGAALRTQGPLTGVVTYTSNSYVAGSSVTIRVTCDSNPHALEFPAAWVFVGTKPTAIDPGKTGILTITSFGTTAADCVAAWAVQE